MKAFWELIDFNVLIFIWNILNTLLNLVRCSIFTKAANNFAESKPTL